MDPFCLLDFSRSLGYSPRHVPLRDFICQHPLGFSATPFLERTN